VYILVKRIVDYVVLFVVAVVAVSYQLNDQFIQNWNGRLEESSRAIFYKHISSFDFKPYLNI